MIDRKLIAVIRKGGIGVMPTDTIYGLVGSALSRKAVLRIYKVRKRNSKKPLLVLIGSLTDLKRFGVRPNPRVKVFLKNIWPGPYSVILPCTSAKFAYLHRGTRTVAFRFPKPRSLRAFLRAAGPLVAPSANSEGMPPARTIAEAKHYFGSKVDFYMSGRTRKAPSTLIEVKR